MVFPMSPSPPCPPAVRVQVYGCLCMPVHERIYKYSVVFHRGVDFPSLAFNLYVRDAFLCYLSACLQQCRGARCVSLDGCGGCVPRLPP